jgi:hypothetical protein
MNFTPYPRPLKGGGTDISSLVPVRLVISSESKQTSRLVTPAVSRLSKEIFLRLLLEDTDTLLAWSQ